MDQAITEYRNALAMLIVHYGNPDEPQIDLALRNRYLEASAQIERLSLENTPEYRAAVIGADDDARTIRAQMSQSRRS